MTATLKIFISSDFTTSGTVTSDFPGVNQGFSVIPGVVTQLTVPSGVALQGGIENKGIHITSADPIAVYGLNWQGGTTDAYMALPVPSLGTDYRSLSYLTTLVNQGSCFSVVATQDGTLLTVFNHQTNSTSNVNLEQGETYHVEAFLINEDLTGSRIQSNYPVSVFGSDDCTYLPIGCNYADHIVEQMWPVSSWGKNFALVPLAGRDDSGDIFRILASEDGTVVSINSTIVSTLNTGEYYQTTLTGYNAITTTKASAVAQFAKGINCSGGITGDPFMMLIPPREQFLTNYTIGTAAGFTSHWVNVVAPDYALGTIYQDGILIPNSAFTQIAGTNYYGAQRSITHGSHTFTSVIPFGVFVYGWTNVNSYGYPGGGSLSPVGTVDSVSLSPLIANGILNETTLCFTAHVIDDFLNPVEGVLVTFYVSGIASLVGNAYTNNDGDALFCYMQTGTTPGLDSMYAEVFGFTSDTALISWSYTPPCTNPTDAGIIGNPQSVCSGVSPSALTSLSLPSGQTGTLEYKWQQSETGGGSDFIDIPGSDFPVLSPGPLLQSTWFRRVARVDCMPDWSGAVISNEIKITVIPRVTPEVIIFASADTVCEGIPVTFTGSFFNEGSAPICQWQVNETNAGTNNAVFTYSPVNGDMVRCILTSSELCTSGNPDTSSAIAIFIYEPPEVNLTACFDTVTTLNAKPFQLKGGIPLGGSYSGPGVASGYFYPALAGAGTHQITYSYTNSNLCEASSSRSIRNYPVFNHQCGNALLDFRDNQSYPTIQIGSQCWLAANLNYGQQIVASSAQRDNCLAEKYCYEELPVNCVQHGALYQWDEVMGYEDTEGIQGFCPPGWHLPSEADWIELFDFFHGNAFAGSPLLTSGYSGFNALLSGLGAFNTDWSFEGSATLLWSSTAHGERKAWAHGLNSYNYSVSFYPSYRANAFSVRCVMD